MRVRSNPIKFRKWIELENLKKKLSEAVESSDFPDRVIDYLSAAYGDKKWESKPYRDTVFSLAKALKEFSVDLYVPIAKAPLGGKDADWEYENRNWFYLSHLLAQAYGWEIEYIANLTPNDALAYIQEILTDEQLEHEFYYGLSEVAFVYDKATKKSNFKPMPRPYWMKPIAPQKPKKMKIRRDMLPVGLIKDVSGLPQEFQIEGLEVQKG